MTNLQIKVMAQFGGSYVNGLVHFNSMGERFVLTANNRIYIIDEGDLIGGNMVGSIDSVEAFVDFMCD